METLTVYRVEPARQFATLEFTDPEEGQRWLHDHPFDGSDRKVGWSPPPVHVHANKRPEPDIWFFPGCRHVLVYEKPVPAKIDLFSDQSGQTLLLTADGRKFEVLNITNVIECLNKKKSVFDEGDPQTIKQYEFYGDRLGYSLFGIPQTSHFEVLCVQGVVVPVDEFKSTVKRLGLKGLRFKKIWKGPGRY